MKKFWKGFIAVFGAINVVMSILIPISVAILVSVQANLSTFNSTIIMIVGFGASLFRSIKFLIK